MMERIASEVQQQLGRFTPAAGLGRVLEAWPRAVGDGIARNAWPARLARDGTLHVSTASAAWAFELTHLEDELAARLQAELGEGSLPRLRFAVGELPGPAAAAVDPEKRRVAPSDSEREEAARLAAGIESPELREAVARVAAESLARSSAGRSFW